MLKHKMNFVLNACINLMFILLLEVTKCIYQGLSLNLFHSSFWAA